MSFEEIYDNYFRDVYIFSLSLSTDPSIAEEITQETFFKALRSIDQFDGKKDIKAWLFTIAKNAFFTYRRKSGKFTPLDENTRASDSPLDEVLEDEDMAFRVHQLLHNMKEPYKEVFSLRVFGELSFDKIGSLFGKNAGWARVVFYRARKQIQMCMEAICDE